VPEQHGVKLKIRAPGTARNWTDEEEDNWEGVGGASEPPPEELLSKRLRHEKKYWDTMDRSKLETRLKEWKARYPAHELDDVNRAVVTDPGRRVNVHDDDKLIVDTTQGYYGNIGFVDAMFWRGSPGA